MPYLNILNIIFFYFIIEDFAIKIVHIFTLQLAKAEKLKPLEVELRRLEDLSKSIVDDFEYMKSREKMMRDTNGEYFYQNKNISSINETHFV